MEDQQPGWQTQEAAAGATISGNPQRGNGSGLQGLLTAPEFSRRGNSKGNLGETSATGLSEVK